MRRLPLGAWPVALLLALPARAQPAAATAPDSARRPVWVNVGVGPSSPDAIAVGASVTVETRPTRVVIGRAVYAEEFCLFGCSNPDRTFEVGALAGWAAHSRWGALVAAAGLSLVAGRRGGYSAGAPGVETRCAVATVGVPAEVQLYVRPFRGLGVGVTGFADPNARDSFAGFAVGLQLGRLTR